MATRPPPRRLVPGLSKLAPRLDPNPDATLFSRLLAAAKLKAPAQKENSASKLCCAVKKGREQFCQKIFMTARLASQGESGHLYKDV